MSEDFTTFWQAYPRRVGKLAALKSYVKARTVATAEEILAGVELYCAHLPEDVKYVAHPASWLNQGRWMDEYEAVAPMVSNRTAALARASAAFLGSEVKRLD